jgi:CubicO group peptidase (beta-lactamase class C family)
MSKYIPNFPLQGRRVTIRHLLNHTSGIHSYTASPAWRATWANDIKPDSIIGFVANDTFDFAPGTNYRYNNTGYVLLGMVIEKATGQKYADYLDKEFFKPLGLKQTTYCPSKTSDPSYALGYSKTPSGTGRAEYLHLSHPFAAGAICSTVADYSRWQRALAYGKVVSPASYTLMTTADTLITGRRINYGFGLVPGNLAGHKTVGHGGGIPGFTTSGMFVPDDTLSVVVFTNYDGSAPDGLAGNLLRVAYGMAPVAGARPGQPQQLPLALRAAVIGEYTLQLPGGQKLPVKFFMDGTKVMSQAEGQPAVEITYLGNNQFGVAFDPALRWTFTFDAEGKATKVTLLQSGATVEGPRNP